ncbi:SDR family NAD(P)-dependent oxidoreductase [Aestuariicoccus sp. MJ-SS9]|uniref:SDR family NAD(P)-dependent oxidoreductase n=1 Tax=Aestuariicoccus sp. MJ-SS9 TaxID=3079855 RepID=UPI0029150125|nr:SDR family NAD(P)-dependent oxidoreductase [Aestuariicoccus sp. MJ-SS9]MDU8912708.1 SDR family NAD(P)-dependent oxidoreductase [Aestuariicoccus sp. MJ-SS9]
MIFENRFAGRRAVVTGGASGIGKGIADRLAAEGADVIVWDLADTATRRIDVTDADAVTAAMAEDAPDILVCSAGITGPNTTVADYPLDAWHKVFTLNVHGLFYCNRAAASVMPAKGWGRIVNIASVAGKEGNPNASAYSASKAAVIGLTKSLGKELATTGVTVNAVAPAAVETAIFEQMSAEHIAYMKSKIPMNRFGSIEEITAMVCWLASDEASFATGAVFDQSGGRATY